MIAIRSIILFIFFELSSCTLQAYLLPKYYLLLPDEVPEEREVLPDERDPPDDTLTDLPPELRDPDDLPKLIPELDLLGDAYFAPLLLLIGEP